MPKYHQPGDSIYTVVQEPPKYKAGEFEFYVDLLERVEYIGWPMDEWQSQVVIEFVVDINGIVKDAKIKGKNKNEYTNMEKAFVKAIEGMKGWKVGFIEGVKVPTCIVRCIRVGRPTN
ncbi:MAG: hypothetical protein K2H01_01410 [Ruminococcus sp.]|nr:hypothetical protein [Ruminococcus sp.]